MLRRVAEEIVATEQFMNFFLDLIEGVAIAELIDADEVRDNRKVVGREVNIGNVAINPCQTLAHNRIVGEVLQGSANLFSRQGVAGSQNVFQRAKLLNKTGCGLLTNAFDAGDIIGRVTAQAFIID